MKVCVLYRCIYSFIYVFFWNTSSQVRMDPKKVQKQGRDERTQEQPRKKDKKTALHPLHVWRQVDSTSAVFFGCRVGLLSFFFTTVPYSKVCCVLSSLPCFCTFSSIYISLPEMKSCRNLFLIIYIYDFWCNLQLPAQTMSAAIFIVIALADRGLFCSSINLLESLDNPTLFCILSGKG